MSLLSAGEVAEELLELPAEILDRVLVHAERTPDAIGEPDRAAEAHVDPARVQRLEDTELLGHNQRLVVG
jgi:hypothetical protein